VYFVINNRSTSQDHLLSAASDVAAVTQVHQTTIDASGKASMAEQAVLTVPTRSQVDFKPGGLHVMLMDLKKDLKPGDSVPLTLTFEQAGTVKIEAEVREP
jgi:copper(I)-binding protein